MEAAEGMRAILRRARPPPQVLVTDADPGFKSERFQEVLKDRRIIHVLREGRNDISAVDRLIFALKRTMAAHEAEGDDRSLQDIVDGINASGTKELYGSAPEDFRDGPNNALVFQREWDESHYMQENAKRIHMRAEKLQRLGAYRTLENKGFRRRAGQAIWSRAVHPVRDLRGALRRRPSDQGGPGHGDGRGGGPAGSAGPQAESPPAAAPVRDQESPTCSPATTTSPALKRSTRRWSKWRARGRTCRTSCANRECPRWPPSPRSSGSSPSTSAYGTTRSFSV
jgi:hypothetical protein